ncbi:uncharacterized protein LOC115621822 [Scaptodrosophila lebanonensis]|uniref:Uncharacterized protein LOC115621822 n=1 Tax=Drosophila lebanonensis TaxID=7225 RepID=A0A6J2T625_DROLE|nr:uncharacterized protein LOC115621822 [Scaptodrosophila lebanonensis]
MDEFYNESESDDSNILYEGDQNTIPQLKNKRERRSFVWEYFDELESDGNPKVSRCRVCKTLVSTRTTNLARHLECVHNIVRLGVPHGNKRSRPSRSFIWKYCTRANEKQAFCHLCDKLLFFGGGNTSNITKHLRRKHSDIIQENELEHDDSSGENLKRIKAKIKVNEINDKANRFFRKGSSYVWKYCEKVSRYTVRCKLCNRSMRFHGTANVISHLQRKHKIADYTNIDKHDNKLAEAPADEELDSEISHSQRLNGNGACSGVWKYCVRINEDVVRCLVCSKNLSYQGTSNLQRHLHRMHNIVASIRASKVSQSDLDNPMESNTLLQFCQITDDPQLLKCQMCDEVFQKCDEMEPIISKHMVIMHGVRTSTSEQKGIGDDSLEDGAIINEFDIDNIIVEEPGEAESTSVDENSRFQVIYDEFIEVDRDVLYAVDEEALNGVDMEAGEQFVDDPMAVKDEVTADNPFSPHSSVDSATKFFSNNKKFENDPNGLLISAETDDTPRLLELKEELVRQQTLYFNEKAAFYRMQKYLCALQAKKELLEIEMLKSEQKSISY